MGRKKKAENEGGAGPGHNKPELTEDEMRCLLYGHKAAYEQVLREEAAIKAKKKEVAALAKAEYGPDAIADIKELILLEQPKGPEALRVDMERKARLARWANATVGHQFRFDDFDATPATDHARELGKTAGLKGEPKKPPYDPSVPQYQAWMEGWDAGQEVTLSDFRSKLKPMDEVPDGEGGDDDGAQIDLSERPDLVPGDDMPPLADLPRPDVSNPPFAASGDDGLDITQGEDVRASLRRTPAPPSQPQ